MYFNFYYLFIFINNQGKQHKMIKKLNTHLYRVNKQDYHMSGVRVLTVIMRGAPNGFSGCIVPTFPC